MVDRKVVYRGKQEPIFCVMNVETLFSEGVYVKTISLSEKKATDQEYERCSSEQRE